MHPLKESFYLKDSLILARQLLGKVIVREINHKSYFYRIVETEAYRGYEDKGAHSYGGKLTNRTKPMFEEG